MARTPHPPKEQVKFWRDPALQDLELLRATYITYAFSRHAHEGYGIAIVESGAMAFDYRGATHIAPAGSVVVTHPGEMHTGHAALEVGWTYRTLLPASAWLEQAAKELQRSQPLSAPFFPSPVICDQRLNRQLVGLHHALETSPSALERESRLLWHMAFLVGHYASDKPIIAAAGREQRAVLLVRDYLVDHHDTNPSLKELADLVGLTPLRLLRSFRKQMGLPPHAYLNHWRVHRAKRLLASGWAIADAAIETGFTDQSHLHRHFKKMVGVTPGQYVRGCRSGL
ncbi:MAG: AraC family transcriptional regulator [Cyanobacteria bacterium P01_A01_bin.135]